MIADFHNDILTVKPIENELDNLSDGVLALYKGTRDFQTLFSLAHNYTGHFFLAFEDIGGISDRELERLISFRPQYVTLTWNYENDLAYGCLASGRLKKRGKEVIQKLTQHDIYIDTAHLCRKSFFDVCDQTDLLVNSHTAFSDVHFHFRNIDDEQIKLLFNLGATIGITFVSSFLTEKQASAADVIRHADHYVQKFGCVGLSIGSDFFGTDNLPIDLFNYKNWGNLVENFLKIGYNIEVINQILYHNLKKFLYRS